MFVQIIQSVIWVQTLISKGYLNDKARARSALGCNRILASMRNDEAFEILHNGVPEPSATRRKRPTRLPFAKTRSARRKPPVGTSALAR